MLSCLLSASVFAAVLGALARPSSRAAQSIIPFAAKFNSSNADGTRFNIAQADCARIDAIQQRAQTLKSGNGKAKRASAVSVDATNSAVGHQRFQVSVRSHAPGALGPLYCDSLHRLSCQ